MNRRRSLLIAGLLAMLPHSLARAQEKTKVILGTATPGGGFPLYGAAFAETVNETDASLLVEPRNTKGSTENIPLIESGQLDIALVTGEPLYEAVNGIGRPAANLKILAAMYSSPGMFVVRGDSPYRSIADLLGKPVAFGAKGSGLVILARYVLDGMGYDMDKDFQAILLDKAGDGPAMVEDERPGRRTLHRARRRAGEAHPREACAAQADDGPGRQLSGAGCSDPFSRFLGIRDRPPDAARRDRLSAGARAAQGGGRNREAPAAGEGNDGSEHGRRCPARRPHPSRRAALPARSGNPALISPSTTIRTAR
jgi:hypothetical protein